MIRALQKKYGATGVAAQKFSFQCRKWMHGKKLKTSDISGTMPTIFFILATRVGEYNGLLNKNYWDDLGIIDQAHGKENVSSICLYLGPILTKF